jgi:hypothetical protein
VFVALVVTKRDNFDLEIVGENPMMERKGMQLYNLFCGALDFL